MKVIALSAWKGSGKDTLAAHLIKTHGAIRTAFADPLKDMAAKEYGVDRSWMDNPEYKESPLSQYPVDPQDSFSRMIAEFLIKEFRNSASQQPVGFHYGEGGKFLGVFVDGSTSPVFWTPRALCIFKGSGNRSVTSEFWVQQAIKDIRQKDEANPFRIHVITDLRFQSEAKQLNAAFGRDLVMVRINRFTESTSSDPSERDMDNFKFNLTLDNFGAPEELFKAADQVIYKLPT